MQGDQDRATALKNYLASIETIQTDWISCKATSTELLLSKIIVYSKRTYFDWCPASKVNKKMLDMPEVRIHLSESVVVESL